MRVRWLDHGKISSIIIFALYGIMLLAGFEYDSKVGVPAIVLVLASLTCICRDARNSQCCSRLAEATQQLS
jgi:hypothetical protein